jgi:hypothetical protein
MLKNVHHSDHADVAPGEAQCIRRRITQLCDETDLGNLADDLVGVVGGDDATGPRLFVATPKDGLRGAVVGLDGPLFTGVRGKKNSRKFVVTSGHRFGLQGCRSLRTLSLPARIEGKFVGFVARACYEQWRLATLQLHENFSKERHPP